MSERFWPEGSVTMKEGGIRMIRLLNAKRALLYQSRLMDNLCLGLQFDPKLYKQSVSELWRLRFEFNEAIDIMKEEGLYVAEEV